MQTIMVHGDPIIVHADNNGAWRQNNGTCRLNNGHAEPIKKNSRQMDYPSDQQC